MNTISTDGGTGGTGRGDVPLDFDAWVGLSARLLKLDQDARLGVLDERGLDVDDWMRCDEHYCRVLANDVGGGQMERAETYGRACAAELERRRRMLTLPQEAPALEPGPAPAEPEAPAPVAAPALEVASFQKETAAPACAPVSLAGTIDVADFPSFLKSATGALPFVGSSSPELVPSASAPRAPAPGAGQTLDVDAAQVHATLPFTSRSAAPAFPRLPLQSYASLCAELKVYPERAAEILEKYGIRDDQTRLALDADWQARLAGHADTREKWQRLCADYEGWLRQQPR